MSADETAGKTTAGTAGKSCTAAATEDGDESGSRCILERLEGYFASRDDAAFAFLFGSYARGKATGRSDVDVALYFARTYDLTTVNRVAGDLETLLRKCVDLIVLNEANASVAWAALRGIPLVIRDQAFYLRYMLDASREAEDFSELLYDLWRLRREHRRVAKGLSDYGPSSGGIDVERTSRDSIIRRLEFARTELADLEAFADLDFSRYTSDRVVRRNVERMIENIVNSLSGIGKIILSQTDIEMPDSYRSIFEKLGSLGLIEAGLSTRLADTTRLRNILAHQYLDIKWKHIEAFLAQGRTDARAFLDKVGEWLAGEGANPH